MKKKKSRVKDDDIEAVVVKQRKNHYNRKADIKRRIVEAVKAGNIEVVNKLKKVLLNG